MKFNSILLFGAPGVGKGTQGKVLGMLPGFIHCACGDVFRGLTADSELGRTFLQYSSRGELVPDEYTVKLWRQAIEARIETGTYHPERDTLVLDGIPRSLNQAQLLADSLDVRAIFYLTCPDRSKLIHRMQRRALRENRLDDANYEIILRRLETYEQETKPVLDFYGKHLVHEVDSSRKPVEVLHGIVEKLTEV